MIYIPSKEVIAKKCKDIQTGWSESVKRRRLAMKPEKWLPPKVFSEAQHETNQQEETPIIERGG